jgi:CheY-like chemotaxis protein
MLLHFSVRDTGIGIPADRLDRLFKSFSQVDDSITKRFGGTGLGLAISRRLCELMGGRIWVESEPGKGTTFHFTLPTQAVAGIGRLYPEDSGTLAGKRLLIVDDNANNRLLLGKQAARWGMITAETASGFQALDWLREGKAFDLAILDMQMPDLDGETLAEEIRKVRPAEVLPLVMLTSIGRRDKRLGRLGLAAFLDKPIKQSRLYNVLHGILVRPEQQSHSKAEPIADEVKPHRPLRILVAEDNLINQKVVQALLHRMGYRADIVANGLEAVTALRDRPYDVVLMDMQMPEMDGLEATRAIRQGDQGASHPWILALTANVLASDREACLDAGMNDCIFKPIKPAALLTALQQCPAPTHRLVEQM